MAARQAPPISNTTFVPGRPAASKASSQPSSANGWVMRGPGHAFPLEQVVAIWKQVGRLPREALSASS